MSWGCTLLRVQGNCDTFLIMSCNITASSDHASCVRWFMMQKDTYTIKRLDKFLSTLLLCISQPLTLKMMILKKNEK